MGNRSRKLELVHEVEPARLGELIHDAVRVAIERAVREELEAALGAAPWERAEVRHGYRNGSRERLLSGPTGPVPLTVPRATLFGSGGGREWSSKVLPRYQRRLPELNEAIAGAYLAGTNTRRIKGALRPLLKAAPLSKSAVSRVVGTLKGALDAWRTRSLAGLEVVYLYLDAIALRVRTAGKVVSSPREPRPRGPTNGPPDRGAYAPRARPRPRGPGNSRPTAAHTPRGGVPIVLREPGTAL